MNEIQPPSEQLATAEQPALHPNHPTKYRATCRHFLCRRFQLDYEADSKDKAIAIAKALQWDDDPLADGDFGLVVITSVRPVADKGPGHRPCGINPYWPEVLGWLAVFLLLGALYFWCFASH